MRVATITEGISNIFESFFEFVFESIFESGHKVVELRSAPEQRTDLILYGIRAFTGVYYSFIPKPLNLIIFSKKLKTTYYFLRKRDSENLEKWIKNLQLDIKNRNTY